MKRLHLRRELLIFAQRNYLDFPIPRWLNFPLTWLEYLLHERYAHNIVIEKPIFIVGCHRSGTTILYETLSQHPDLTFFTNASSLLPHIPILTNQIISWFGVIQEKVERFAQDGLTISYATPSEGVRIWELFAPEGGDYYLDETYNNLEMENYLKLTIQKHLQYFHAKRFINKNPDNSVRIRYLNKLFPDAYFIHIVRDGRAVSHSLLKFRKAAAAFFGPDHRHATSGVKVKVWHDIAQYWQTDPILSTGLLWREVLETIERDRQYIAPERYLELCYEDFAAQPLLHLQQICQFCQLPWSANIQAIFAQATSDLSLGDRNQAWQEYLTPNDIERLMTVIGAKMQDYGYAISRS